VSDVAPTELGEILRNAFYKHSAPMALRNWGIRQRYLEPPHSKASRALTLNLMPLALKRRAKFICRYRGIEASVVSNKNAKKLRC
jgi:hypothetical protein